MKELILVGLQVTGRWSANLFRNSLFTSNYPCHLILHVAWLKFLFSTGVLGELISAPKSLFHQILPLVMSSKIFFPFEISSFKMLFLNIKALKVSFFCKIAYSHITHCSYIPHICSSRKTPAIYKHCTKKEIFH